MNVYNQHSFPSQLTHIVMSIYNFYKQPHLVWCEHNNWVNNLIYSLFQARCYDV